MDPAQITSGTLSGPTWDSISANSVSLALTVTDMLRGGNSITLPGTPEPFGLENSVVLTNENPVLSAVNIMNYYFILFD